MIQVFRMNPTLPLTAQEQHDLNVWIAIHAFGYEWCCVNPAWLVRVGCGQNDIEGRSLVDPKSSNSVGSLPFYIPCSEDLPLDAHPYQYVLDYAGTWEHAGKIFDQYQFCLTRYTLKVIRPGETIYSVREGDTDEDIFLAQGTTGPEAIAKATKVYIERQREQQP